MRRASRLFLISFLTSLPAIGAAQGKFPPDSLVNVTVLPKSMPMGEFIGVMRGFTRSLGVRCTYCHVGQETQPLTAYDFASDDKRAKRVARVMLTMATAINSEHLASVPSRPSPPLTVSCETCHRGVARPEPIDRVIGGLLATHGVDSAARAYRGLLSSLGPRGSYDFTDVPLSGLAQRLAAQNRLDDALSILSVNDDTHPTSANVPLVRGDILLARRDTAGAVAAYQTSLQRDPNGPARQRLRVLGRQ